VAVLAVNAFEPPEGISAVCGLALAGETLFTMAVLPAGLLFAAVHEMSQRPLVVLHTAEPLIVIQDGASFQSSSLPWQSRAK
jgi:hypothetical protein